MKRLAALTAATGLAIVPAAQAHDLTASQERTFKHRWQLSAYKVNWYNHQGRWTLRPRYTHCAQIRWRKPRGQCFKHRANLRWHGARMNRLARILWPPPPQPLYNSHAAADSCLSTLIERESQWNVIATNPSTGAYGLPQALPGSKMASAGPDWQTNPQTQIRWMIGYVNARYGGSCAALSFQIANGYY